MRGVFVAMPRVAPRLVGTLAELWEGRESKPKFNRGLKYRPKGEWSNFLERL